MRKIFEDLSKFSLFLPLTEGANPILWTNLNPHPHPQACFLPSLVEIGLVVVEKKSFKEKVDAGRTDGRCTMHTLSWPSARWANNQYHTHMQIIIIIIWLAIFLHSDWVILTIQFWLWRNIHTGCCMEVNRWSWIIRKNNKIIYQPLEDDIYISLRPQETWSSSGCKSLYRHQIKVNNCIIYEHKLKTVPDMLLKHVIDMEKDQTKKSRISAWMSASGP